MIQKIIAIILCLFIGINSVSAQYVSERDKCPSCNGTGLCQECHGSGGAKCTICNGNKLMAAGENYGTCPFCRGIGCDECNHKGYFSAEQCTQLSKPCLCSLCKGTGRTDCAWCKGTGKCPDCHGTGSKSKGKIADVNETISDRLSMMITEGPPNALDYPKFYFGFCFGLGYMSMPMITNTVDAAGIATPTSGVSDVSPFCLETGFKIGLFANRGISFYLSPYVVFGDDFLGGESGTHVLYGGTGTLYVSRRYYSKLSAFLEFGYESRVGSYTLDGADLAASVGVTSDIDLVTSGTYNYSVKRFGGGLRLRVSKEDDQWVRAGIYQDHVSFVPAGYKPSTVGEVEWLVIWGISLDLTYSHNYAIAGTILYPKSFTPGNLDFWQVSLLKTVSLIKH